MAEIARNPGRLRSRSGKRGKAGTSGERRDHCSRYLNLDWPSLHPQEQSEQAPDVVSNADFPSERVFLCSTLASCGPMRQIQRQRERVLDRGFDSVRPTKLFLNSLEIDEKWVDANGATEMQMTTALNAVCSWRPNLDLVLRISPLRI
jgi:hypothetical protein